jgi:hypothetical protein
VSWGTSVPEGLAPEVWEALGDDGALLSAISVEVDGTSPLLGDDTGGLL